VIPDIDGDALDRIVGRRVTSYLVTPIDPQLRLHSVTGGVFRVHGDGFSLVAKVVRRGLDEDPGALWVAGGEPSHRNYWKREWIAFDSGLLSSLPGRLRAPRLLLTTEPAEDECWIWMEDIAGRHGASLTLGDYRRIAADLGTTQGAYAAGSAVLPEDAWLSREWLRGWVSVCARYADAVADDERWQDERLAAYLPLRDRISALWTRREDLLAVVESAPPTLVHCDFWPTNLFVTEADESVAIDWSQIGIGRVAQDLDQMTLDPVWMQVRPDGSLDDLEQAVLAGYADGLQSSGCAVDAVELRRWYAAAAAAHYPWMAGVEAVRAADDGEVAASERRFGRPLQELSADRARVVRRAVELGEWVLGFRP
jgi:hypothetical protein